MWGENEMIIGMKHVKKLMLILPAIIPSWRFFDVIAASPRIEYRIIRKQGETATKWMPFRPTPQTLSIREMITRLIWNPWWNENLYLVSCAERVFHSQCDHAKHVIAAFVKRHALDSEPLALQTQFRILFIYREDNKIQTYEGFTSPFYDLKE